MKPGFIKIQNTFNASGHWTPQSLVVEDAAPTHVVMTGSVANTNAVAGDFTVTGITATVNSISRDGTNKIITAVLNVSATYGDVFSIIYRGKSYLVTNNVSIYISDLVTRHSGVRTGYTLTESLHGLNAKIIPSMPIFSSAAVKSLYTTLNLSGLTDVDITTWLWRDDAGKKVTQGIEEGSSFFDILLWTGGTMLLQVGAAGNYGTVTTSITGLHKIRVKYLGAGATNADKLKCWIDDTPVSITFTGTIPTVIPTFSTSRYRFNSIFAPAYFSNGAIGETSITINGTLAHKYPLCEQGKYCYDVIGTAHASVVGGDLLIVPIYIDGGGSTHFMDYGYSVYYKSGLPTEYVPYNISSSPVPQSGMADYWKKFVRPDRAGSLTTYNNAPAMIDFDPTDSSDARLVNFKRSDTTVCSTTARTGYYDATQVYRWHIAELNKYLMLAFYNSGYKNKVFPKMDSDSLNTRNALTEILNYSTDKTDASLNNVLNYTNDKNQVFLEVRTSALHLCASKGDKILAFDGTNTLSLSLDKGATYGITKNVGLSLITFAHIFDNGNIVFFDGTKGYLSTDNLSSFAETTIKNISGGTYSPYASDNYKVWSYDYETINGVEVLVFGNYTNVNPRANAWYSVDNGVTIKSFNEAVGGHYHGINYDRISGKWMANVGDGNLVREFIYNTVTDQWTLNRSLTVPASVGFSRFGDYYYWFSDTVGNTVPYGFYRVRVEDVADAATKLETMQLYETSTGVWVDDTEKLMYGYNKLLDGIIYSTDGVNFFVMAGGGAGIATTHPDNNHEYLGQIIKDGPNYVLYTVGPVYMLKIGRCLY